MFADVLRRRVPQSAVGVSHTQVKSNFDFSGFSNPPQAPWEGAEREWSTDFVGTRSDDQTNGLAPKFPSAIAIVHDVFKVVFAAIVPVIVFAVETIDTIGKLFYCISAVTVAVRVVFFVVLYAPISIVICGIVSIKTTLE